MIIKWSDDSIQDLIAVRRYIAKENPSAADDTALRILSSINLLPEQPGLGMPGRVLGTRELVVTGTAYIIPYRVKNNTIEILRVFHSAMEWPHVL
jgi:toxin ParE1/3/4